MQHFQKESMRSQTNIQIVIPDFLDSISDSNFAATIHPKAEPDEKEGKPIFTQDSADMMYNFLSWSQAGSGFQIQAEKT